MTVTQALRELDELLKDEERALIEINLEHVVTLSTRKAELVRIVGDRLGGQEIDLSGIEENLARSVHDRAHRNRFLLQHLRGCLRTVSPESLPSSTYGRDGRASSARGSGMVRVRL